MNNESIYYAIKLSDGGYASFYQEYNGDPNVHVLSHDDISEADFYNNEDKAQEALNLLIKGETEDEVFIFGFGSAIRPLKIVRLTIKVEEEW